MAIVFLLLFFSCILAFFCNQYRIKDIEGGAAYNFQNNNEKSLLFFFTLLVLLVLFSGTRTWGNDTPGYIRNFLYCSSEDCSLRNILALDLGSNPGFKFYQGLLKSIFDEKFIYFLTISALIVNGSILIFFYKYSRNFFLSVFLYIASVHYAFTLGAQKQVLAIAIGIWLLPLAIQKKWGLFVVILLLAMSFHPYVIMLAVIPFFIDKVWGKKSFCTIIAAIVFVWGMNKIIPMVVNATAMIGDDYEVLNHMESGIGVSVFRVLVLAVTPCLSFVYRKKINQINNQLMIGCCNMSLMAFACMMISAFADPNLFGRLAAYFEIFTYTALASILSTYVEVKYKNFLWVCCFTGYTIFYYVFYTKYGSLWFYDIYRHQSLLEYF